MEWGQEEAPKAREAFRRRSDGQLGFMVERHGARFIRLDRPGEEILSPYNENIWVAEEHERPMARAQVSRIAFDADRSYCRAMGELSIARQEWHGLSDKDRIAWVDNGPPEGTKRREIYEAIFACFPGTQ